MQAGIVANQIARTWGGEVKPLHEHVITFESEEETPVPVEDQKAQAAELAAAWGDEDE